MKNIGSIAAGLWMAVAAFCGGIGPAHASLMVQDLIAASDGLVTLDTATGLEWLDVDATLGQSYDAAEASVYATTYGFRHATQAEIQTFYQGVGITADMMYSAANFAGAQELLDKLGCTGNCGTDSAFQEGMTDVVPFSAAGKAIPYVQVSTTTSEAAAGCVALNGSDCVVVSNSFFQSNFGNYLVRAGSSAIPEPATWGLMLAGLAGWAGLRRRRAG